MNQQKLAAPLVQDPISGTALITGGTSGLGYEFARALAARGVNLVLVARDTERLITRCAELTAQFNINCEYLTADLMLTDDVVKVKTRLQSEINPISILINNAGAGCYSRLAVDDFQQISDATKLMALSPMELGGAAAKAMQDRGSGVIVTTASVQSLVPMGAYAAIKAFVRTWSDSLSVEMQGTGVHVLTLMPGWVKTEFHARTGVSNSSIPDWVWLDPQEVVAQALSDIAKGKTTSTASARFKVISFLAKHGPQSVVRKVAKKLNKGRR